MSHELDKETMKAVYNKIHTVANTAADAGIKHGLDSNIRESGAFARTCGVILNELKEMEAEAYKGSAKEAFVNLMMRTIPQPEGEAELPSFSDLVKQARNDDNEIIGTRTREQLLLIPLDKREESAARFTQFEHRQITGGYAVSAEAYADYLHLEYTDPYGVTTTYNQRNNSNVED